LYSEQSILQRSETFIVSKKPSEELPSSLPMKENDHSIPLRPSKLPYRCSTSNQKVSKLPIRTTTSLNRQQIPTKKSNIPTPIASKTKLASNRSIPSVNNSSIKKVLQPSSTPVTQSQSSSIEPTPKTNNITPTIEIIESNDPIKPMKSTSSESSIEEQQSMNKLLPLVQDEGYSTWSSMDVKDDAIRNIGFIKIWLDTTDRQSSKTPVKDGMNHIFEIFLNVTDAFDNIVDHSMYHS
jgi:hypothetical protein